jgi:hypothetical protein
MPFSVTRLIRSTGIAHYGLLRLAACAALVLPGATSSLAAQAVSVTNLEARPDCKGCTIELSKIATLSDPTGGVDIDAKSVVTRDRDGRYYVWIRDRSGIAMFDQVGKLLRVIGRSGRGPGEFDHVEGPVAAGRGDSLFVFSNRTLSVWTPDRKFARSAGLPSAVFDLEMLDSGSMLINAAVRTPESAGFPLHVLSATGAVLRSFGAEKAELSRACFACILRHASLDRDRTTVWVTLPGSYELQQWTLSGQLRRRLLGHSPWFPTITEAEQAAMRVQLSPITEVNVDDDGLIWIRARYPAIGVASTETQARGVSAIRTTPAPGCVLEVIDPKLGRLVASQHFDSLSLHFVGANIVSAPREDRDGFVSMDIYRVSLHHP